MPDVLDPISFLGVDGSTGKRAFSEMALGDLAALFDGKRDAEFARQQARQDALEISKGIGFSEEVDDPNELGQTGWAVAFTESVDADSTAALAKLLAHRKQQVARGRRPEDAGKLLFRDDLIIKSTDTIDDLRTRWQFSPGIVDPGKVPGYILI